jgi:hypothetical protein
LKETSYDDHIRTLNRGGLSFEKYATRSHMRVIFVRSTAVSIVNCRESAGSRSA